MSGIELKIEHSKWTVRKSKSPSTLQRPVWARKFEILLKSVQTDKIALQKEMSGMIDRLRNGSDIAIEIGEEDDLTEIIIN